MSYSDDHVLQYICHLFFFSFSIITLLPLIYSFFLMYKSDRLLFWNGDGFLEGKVRDGSETASTGATEDLVASRLAQRYKWKATKLRTDMVPVVGRRLFRIEVERRSEHGDTRDISRVRVGSTQNGK